MPQLFFTFLPLKSFFSLFVFPFQRRQPFFTFLPFYLFTFLPLKKAFLPLKVPPQSHLQAKVARMFFEHGLHVAAVVEIISHAGLYIHAHLLDNV